MKQSALIEYTLYLADNALILGHRNSEWCGHGPILEQDIAITNISLDLIGQARNFYQHAADLINQSTFGRHRLAEGDANQAINPATEDSLAYLRGKNEFKNCTLLELPKGDWAKTILRQFYFSNYQYLLYQELQNSKDEQIAAIATKALKEVTYHIRWSGEWVIRLGDGTKESHDRMLHAISELESYTNELFDAADYEQEVKKNGIGADTTELQKKWEERINNVLTEATLPVFQKHKSTASGKKGNHTEHLEQILSELQYMQRTYPGAEW